MRNIIIAGGLFLVFSFSMVGQELDQYQYVRVPERFEFLKEENQYQLNALTAFLFDKFGFISLYKEQDPEGVEACEVLNADVFNESGLLRTKLYVTLENCKDEVVFTSEVGVSKEKVYKVSYQEALRDAFKSIKILDHKYSPVKPEENDEPEVAPSNEIIIVDAVVSSSEIENIEAENSTFKDITFVNGGVEYSLTETAAGFDIFTNQDSEKFASLVKSGNGENYLYSSRNVRGIAYFDANKNLIIEHLDSNNSQVLTIIFKRKL